MPRIELANNTERQQLFGAKFRAGQQLKPAIYAANNGLQLSDSVYPTTSNQLSYGSNTPKSCGGGWPKFFVEKI